MKVYKCKCKICGKQLTTDIAYKVRKGNKNNYYCSEEEYQKLQKAVEDRDNCYYTAGRIMRVPLITPSMKKEINMLSEYYDFVVIERTFRQQKEVIQRFLERGNYNSEYARVRYVMTIIRNNINKVHSEYVAEQKAKADLFKQSEQQQIDVDVMNMLITTNQANTETAKTNSNVSDISAWL